MLRRRPTLRACLTDLRGERTLQARGVQRCNHGYGAPMAARRKDVAAHASVSIKTVPNVVHDHACVAAQTRERVGTAITVIETLAYRPNLSAHHVRKARVGVLAPAIPGLANTSFSDRGNAVIAAFDTLYFFDPGY